MLNKTFKFETFSNFLNFRKISRIYLKSISEIVSCDLLDVCNGSCCAAQFAQQFSSCSFSSSSCAASQQQQQHEQQQQEQQKEKQEQQQLGGFCHFNVRIKRRH